MWYEINVALNGKHFFATDKRSITDPVKLKRVYTALAERFTPSDGYDLTVTSHYVSGHTVDPMTGERPVKTLDELEQENQDGFRNPE